MAATGLYVLLKDKKYKMKITFLGQGYEPDSKNSVGNHLSNLFAQQDLHTFFGISGFASEAGILSLAAQVINAALLFKKMSLIVGVDQGKTSKEALFEINSLKIDSYIFHQEEAPIFHPKIYLFEGETRTALIIGSANMTARGLFGNVESSLLIEFAHSDIEGKELLAQIKSYYNGLFDFTDPNLFKISETVIQQFIDCGIVPRETIVPGKYRVPRHQNSVLVIPKRFNVPIPTISKNSLIADTNLQKIAGEIGLHQLEK